MYLPKCIMYRPNRLVFVQQSSVDLPYIYFVLLLNQIYYRKCKVAYCACTCTEQTEVINISVTFYVPKSRSKFLYYRTLSNNIPHTFSSFTTLTELFIPVWGERAQISRIGIIYTIYLFSFTNTIKYI